MVSKFLAFIKENQLIEKGDRVLMGVSGGADSVVLLDILSQLQNNLGITAAVAHVNYGLRKESDRDEKFVQKLAERYKLAYFSRKAKIAGGNIEEKARETRYSFFNEIANRENFNKIAVAHHKNDLAETFFLNLSRGSGLTGLTSMRPKNGPVIRPLLFISKKEILRYSKNKKLEYVDDVTNKDLSFKRNLIRHKIIPPLEEINPDFVENIADEIKDLRKIHDFLTALADKKYKAAARESSGCVSFNIQSLAKIDPYLQTEILRKAIRHVKLDLRDISRQNILDILNLARDTDGSKEIHLPGILIARRIYDKLEITNAAKKLAEKPKSLSIKRGVPIRFGKWKLFLDDNEKETVQESKYLVHLNIQKELKLLVRCRKPGDRISIGGGHSKRLQDIFVDQKVPRHERKSYPIVVTAEDKVVWIPGVTLNTAFKADEKAKGRFILKAIVTNETLKAGKTKKE